MVTKLLFSKVENKYYFLIEIYIQFCLQLGHLDERLREHVQILQTPECHCGLYQTNQTPDKEILKLSLFFFFLPEVL
jgi:hypothetical protein